MTKSRIKIPATYLAGGIAGIVGLLISFLGRGIVPGRVLGDPLPTVLSAAQIMRGFLYWNWQAPLVHLLFLTLLAGIVVVGWKYVRGLEDWGGEEAVAAARVTAVINVGFVALLEIDAIVVAIYYLMGGLISVWVTGLVAGWFVKLLKR